MTLIPSEGGRFEVEVNGTLLFSKLNSGRHAQPGERSRELVRKSEGTLKVTREQNDG